MLPLGHAALAYLFYVGYAALGEKELPANWALLPLIFGSQFPDLIDKPAAYIGTLMYGRSLAHSVFTFILLSGAIWLVICRVDTTQIKSKWPARLQSVTPIAFTIGYGGHLLGDAHKALLTGRFFDARSLLYPLYVPPESPVAEIPPWIRLLKTYQNMHTHPQLELILFALLVFIGVRVHAYQTS